MGKFQVGDIIRRTRVNQSHISIGDIDKVKRLSFKTVIYLEGRSGAYYDNNFELVVPAKWCIKGCEELRQWQTIEMKNECNMYFWTDEHYYNMIEEDDFTIWDRNTYDIPEGYKEITFDQFHKYIYQGDFTNKSTKRIITFKRK